MKHIISSSNFAFVEFLYGKTKYTDNRAGAAMHYLATMEEGECLITTREEELHIRAGEAFYIPMGLQYQSYWRSEESIRFRSYGFSLFPGNTAYRLQKLPDEAFASVRNIPLMHMPDAAALGRLYTALGDLTPRMIRQAATGAEQLVQQAILHMMRDTQLSVPEIARKCGVSESALYAAFRTAAEITPNDMRQRLTVEKAVQLLTTTAVPVEQISERLGFSSTDYFRRILKKHTGKSPRALRSEARPL